MLSAGTRLRRRAEFDLAVRRGRRAGGRFLTVHLQIPDPAADSPSSTRVGFVVSRAVGPAVVRNRVRRRLRHAARPLVPRLPAGSALVVRAHPDSARASFAELTADLDAVTSRALSRAATSRAATSGAAVKAAP